MKQFIFFMEKKGLFLYLHVIFLYKVKWKVYSHYLKSIGWFLSISTIVMNAIFQSFSIGSNIWLSVWSNDNMTVVNDTVDTAKRDMYLGIYGVLGFGQGMFFLPSLSPPSLLFLFSLSL